MLKTATVSELRDDLSEYIKNLDTGPLLVLSRSRPAAVLIYPDMYDDLVEKLELLEDLVDGRKAISEYLSDKGVAVNAEEVFKRLGH